MTACLETAEKIKLVMKRRGITKLSLTQSKTTETVYVRGELSDPVGETVTSICVRVSDHIDQHVLDRKESVVLWIAGDVQAHVHTGYPLWPTAERYIKGLTRKGCLEHLKTRKYGVRNFKPRNEEDCNHV